MFDDGGGAGPTRATVCRRRTITGVGKDGGANVDDAADDEDVVLVVWALVEVEVLLLLVLGGAAGGEGEMVAVPKGVSSSLTLDEDAIAAGRARG